jgi:hypothetical protein
MRWFPLLIWYEQQCKHWRLNEWCASTCYVKLLCGAVRLWMFLLTEFCFFDCFFPLHFFFLSIFCSIYKYIYYSYNNLGSPIYHCLVCPKAKELKKVKDGSVVAL